MRSIRATSAVARQIIDYGTMIRTCDIRSEKFIRVIIAAAAAEAAAAAIVVVDAVLINI